MARLTCSDLSSLCSRVGPATVATLITLLSTIARAQSDPTPPDNSPEELVYEDAAPSSSESVSAAASGAPPPRTAPPSPVIPGSKDAYAARRLEDAPPVEAEDVVLLLPRALLFIPGLATRLVFVPIRGTLDVVERYHVIEEVEDILYNDERTAAIVPALSLSSAFGPQLGAQAFHDDLGGNRESGSIRAELGGRYEQNYEVSFKTDPIASAPFWIEAHTTFEVANQLLFQGIGDGDDRPTDGIGLSPYEASAESFYRHQRFRQFGTFGASIPAEHIIYRVGLTGRLKRHDFGAARRLAADEVTITRAYDETQLAGFEDGATVFEIEARTIVDSRDKRGATSSGYYFEAYFGGAPPTHQVEFIRYGGELTGYFDIYRKTRVLIVRVAHEAVLGADEKVPFVELPSLGGAHRLRGYQLGRFRDEKTMLGTVEYRYPIHQLLSGALYLDGGTVIGSYDEIADARLRVGGGGGFVVHSDDRNFLALDLAYGDGIQFHVSTDPLRAFADRDDDL